LAAGKIEFVFDRAGKLKNTTAAINNL